MKFLRFRLTPRRIFKALQVFDSPEKIGQRGEMRLTKKLHRRLDPEEFATFSDLIISTGSGTTQIDQVVVCRSGVYVIETKNYSGWIFGDANQRSWTQVLNGGKKFRFQNPLHQNFKHIKALQRYLKLPETCFENVVLFAGSAEPKTIFPETVFWNSLKLINYIHSRDSQRLDYRELQRVKSLLSEPSLKSSAEKTKAHVRTIETNVKRRSQNGDGCPRCGEDMKLRKNRKSGEQFLGCSNFPRCRGVRQLSNS